MFHEYDGVLQVDGGVARKSAYDPRTWGRRAREGMAARVTQAAEELGAAGRTIAG
jgi:fructose-bisphosphate aldolase, class II